MVYISWKTRQDQLQELIEAGAEAEEAKKVAPGILSMVKDLTRERLCLQEFNGQHRPMDRILHMKTYSMKIKFTTKAIARVSWVNRYQEIRFDKVSFCIGDLRELMFWLYESCQKGLVQMAMLEREEQLPVLHLHRLWDIHSNMEPGWSFLEDVRNQESLGAAKRPDRRVVASSRWL